MLRYYIVVQLCVGLIHACTNYGGQQPKDESQFPATNTDNPPLILWWYDTLFPHVDGQDTYEFECPGGNTCLASKDRKKLESSDEMTVMIYGSDFKVNDTPLPRKPNHLWALLHEESPQNNYMIQHKEAISLFNYTATFQRSSDYPLTTQALPSLRSLRERPMVSLEEKNKLRKSGTAPLVYIQSNCNVPSDRNRYVEELMKHIEVDSFGSCLNNAKFTNPELGKGVESMHHKDMYTLLANYKFHLAFENAICDDYITEKFFRPFEVGSVPVYYGSDTAREWEPRKGSIIVVKDYASPESLAKFIKYLDENDAAYEKYLLYRKPNGIDNKLLVQTLHDRDFGKDKKMDHFIPGFECYVCDQMHNARKDQKNGIPVHTRVANPQHLACPLPKPSLGKQEKLRKDDRFHMWPELYVQSLYQALALNDMIKAGETDSSKSEEYMKTRYKTNKQHFDL